MSESQIFKTIIGVGLALMFMFAVVFTITARDHVPEIVIHDTEAEAYDATRAQAREVGGLAMASAGTSSNARWLPLNRWVVILPIEYSEIRKHDFLLFEDEEMGLVLHRALHRDSSGWWTRGDSNDAYDPRPVTEENFLGVCDSPVHSWK